MQANVNAHESADRRDDAYASAGKTRPSAPSGAVDSSKSDGAPHREHLNGEFSYGRVFWYAYVANVMFTMAWSLLFRYADFVALLGGTEWHLGWIVGIGMVGSLAMRMFMGSCIDRYGSRIIWIGSLVLFAIVCFGHLMITSCTGVSVYVLRILLCCGFAGTFGASMTFISHLVPVKRMAEAYGMLGTATFVGFLLGTQLSDLMFHSARMESGPDPLIVRQMFWISGIVALLAVPLVAIATRHEVIPQPFHGGPSSWQLLRKYQPGMVLWVAAVVGMVFQLPYAFLRTYTADMDIPRIGLFFTVTAIAAVVTRVLTRRWPERFGNRAIILLGLAAMAVSQLAFLLVHSEWQLAIPAILFGCSQAIVSPPMTAAGSMTFPARNRGLGTTLVQAAGDIGPLIGSPMAGVIVNDSRRFGLPPYPTLFVTLAAFLVIVAIVYAISSRHRHASDVPA